MPASSVHFLTSHQQVEGRENQWRTRRKDVAWSIRADKCSAQGPDGIMAVHWRLGSLATEDLQHTLAEEAIRQA